MTTEKILTHNIYVEIDGKHESLRQFIIDLAQKNDKAGSSKCIYNKHKVLYLCKDAPEIPKIGLHGATSNPATYKKLTKVSVEDFIQAIETPQKPPIIIDGNEVLFRKDGIKVGCTTISGEQIEEIYGRYREEVDEYAE